MKLNELRDNEGARKTRMRVGRGASSGKGKTAGRGAKGQNSRSGVSLQGFEGGQMPLHMRLPKRGFNVPNPKKLNAVNLGRLQVALEGGKLKKTETINATNLAAAGIIRRPLDGVRILAKGALKEKLDFEVAGVSKSAQAVIENLGGKITIMQPKAKAEAASKAKPKKPKAASASDKKASDTSDSDA